MIFRLTEEENFEQAYDEKSAAFVILDNGFNLYLRFLDHLLAVVCVVKDSSYQKKEIIDENFEVLKKTFEKIARTSEKIIREGKK